MRSMNFALFLLLFLVFPLPHGAAASAEARVGLSFNEIQERETRGPIFIQGDGDLQDGPLDLLDPQPGFRERHGIRSGSGTRDDPFVISGWTIDSIERSAIEVWGTTKHIVIRDVGFPVQPEAVTFLVTLDARNVVVEDVMFQGEGDIRIYAGRNIGLRQVDILGNIRLFADGGIDGLRLDGLQVVGDSAGITWAGGHGSIRDLHLENTGTGLGKGRYDGLQLTGLSIGSSTEDDGRRSQVVIENITSKGFRYGAGISIGQGSEVVLKEGWFEMNRYGVKANPSKNDDAPGHQLHAERLVFTDNEVAIRIEGECGSCRFDDTRFEGKGRIVENEGVVAVQVDTLSCADVQTRGAVDVGQRECNESADLLMAPFLSLFFLAIILVRRMEVCVLPSRFRPLPSKGHHHHDRRKRCCGPRNIDDPGDTQEPRRVMPVGEGDVVTIGTDVVPFLTEPPSSCALLQSAGRLPLS